MVRVPDATYYGPLFCWWLWRFYLRHASHHTPLARTGLTVQSFTADIDHSRIILVNGLTIRRQVVAGASLAADSQHYLHSIWSAWPDQAESQTRDNMEI